MNAQVNQGGQPLQLYPFQVEGAEWLDARRHAILADDMGLGKTVQALSACNRVADGLVRVQPFGAPVAVVVICPAIAREVWREEARKWLAPNCRLQVESYDKVARSRHRRDELADFLRAGSAGVLILDEAHALKNHEAKRTKAIYGQYARNNGANLANAREDLYVWPLSGTLMPNDVTELFPHLRALFPRMIGRLGQPGNPMNAAMFRDTYAETEQTPFGVKVRGTKREMAPVLKAILSRCVLRRTLDTVGIQLPLITWSEPINVLPEPDAVTPEEEAELRAAEELIRQRVAAAHGDADLRKLFTAEEAIAIATVQRAMAQMKAPPVGRLIAEELADGAYDKVVVFVRHRAALAELAVILADFEPVIIQGGDGDTTRAHAVQVFQTDAAARVALVMMQTANTALTLTAATQVVFLEMSWVPAENLQAAKRAHRIGQSRPVFVRNFTVKGSSDEMVARAISRKLRGLQAVDMI